MYTKALNYPSRHDIVLLSFLNCLTYSRYWIRVSSISQPVTSRGYNCEVWRRRRTWVWMNFKFVLTASILTSRRQNSGGVTDFIRVRITVFDSVWISRTIHSFRDIKRFLKINESKRLISLLWIQMKHHYSNTNLLPPHQIPSKLLVDVLYHLSMWAQPWHLVHQELQKERIIVR